VLWLPLVSCDALGSGITITVTERDAPPVARPGEEAVDLFYDTSAFLLARKVSLSAELSLRHGLDEVRVSALVSCCRIRNAHCVVEPSIARQHFLDRRTV